jgi:hypothetical protein
MNNLTNIIKSPTRITNHSASLIDVIIVNNTNKKMFTVNIDLGYSDHLAQLLYIKTKDVQNETIGTYKRHFKEENVKGFQYLLQSENWSEVLAAKEVNVSFNIFMDIVSYYFNTAFPLKVTYNKDPIVKKWITKGIMVSRNKLRVLNNIKRSIDLSMGSLKYIQKYQLIYRKVVKEAKRKEADRFIQTAKNKSKALWKLVNRETGNSHQVANITLNTGANKISNNHGKI